MATAKVGPQDLPPQGGYPPIQTERIRLRRVIGWKTGITAFLITNALGWSHYSKMYRNNRRRIIEMRSARMVLTPVLMAERDRAFLKQIIKNRNEEADLMKDYPGWEVGTYFGEPIFHTLPKDTFVEPTLNEFAVHAPFEGGTMFTRMWHRHLI